MEGVLLALVLVLLKPLYRRLSCVERCLVLVRVRKVRPDGGR